MSGTKGSKTEVVKIVALIAGAQKNLTAASKMTVLGVSMLVSAIIARFQAFVDLDKNVGTTKRAWQAAVAARKAQVVDIKTFASGFVTALVTQFGPGNPILQDFGIPAPKVRKQLSAEQKATSAALAKRTKKVRGPTGKNQRAAVTVQGKPGVVFQEATGEVVPGLTGGATPPAVAGPAAPAVAPPSSTPPGGNGGNGSTGK